MKSTRVIEPINNNDHSPKRNETNSPVTSSGNRLQTPEEGTIVSSISDERTNRCLEEFDHRVRFEHALPLCGRIKERNQLLAAFDEVTACNAVATKAVIVRGPSGCGKSALVEKTFRSLFEDSTTSQKGWFVTGKFDQYNGRNDLFSAVIAAVTNLIDLIELAGVVHIYENDVREAIKGNETTFACIFPNLGSITNRQYDITSLTPINAKMFREFISTFKALLSALSRQECPLVLFLDDLQWMDDSTFELLQAFVCHKDTTSSNRHLLLVGAIRSDDPRGETVMGRLGHSVGIVNRESEALTYIELKPPDLDAVNQMISSSLGLAHGSCCSLGSVVYHKTRGNPFAVLKYLDLVASKGLLTYENNSWVWDESKIMSQTNVSNNVLDLVQQTMEHLPNPLTDLLAIAAFLGYEFKRGTLIGLVRRGNFDTYACRDMTECELIALLNRACQEGLVETTEPYRNETSSQPYDTPSYKFSHDKIQQAFYLSVADSDSQKLHGAIGLYLWNELAEKSALEVADHLNRTETHVISISLFVDVNYAAAKLARSRKAYQSSAEYLRRALNRLGTDKWTEHYDRSLEMSTSLLELSVACGDSTEVDSIVREVLEHGRCLEDKLPVIYSKVCFLGSSCCYGDAIAHAISAVRLCGHRIPRNPRLFHIFLLLSAVRRRVSRLNDDDIVNSPTVMDRKVEYLLLLYSRIAAYAVMVEEDSLLTIFCAFRSAQLSLSKGVSSATPMAFAVLGIAEVATGNFLAAARFGSLAMRLVEERQIAPEAAAQSYPTVSCSVLHWSESIDGDFSSILQKGVEAGIMGGEVEARYFCATLHFALELLCGIPLSVVEKHARETCLKMKEFKVEGGAGIAKVIWQSILNLLGQSECPTVLTGEAMNETEHMNDPMIRESISQRMIMTYQKFIVARTLGSFEMARRLATDLKKQFKDYALKSGFYVYEIKFNLALVWYHFAGQYYAGRRQNRKYLSKARTEVKYMKSMKRKGCPNFDSALCILEAEDASFVRKNPVGHVQALYDAAISSLSGKKLQYEAIALEQAALFLIRREDLANGVSYMRRSVSKYLEWNAYAKVALLVNKLGHLVGSLSEEDTIQNMTLCFPLSSAGAAGCDEGSDE